MAEIILSPDAIRISGQRLAPHIVRTPTVKVAHGFFHERFPESEIFLKHELFQKSGTFKFRGVLNNLLSLEEKPARVTAMSAGNHAIAVAVAAKQLGIDAKIVMQASANPARIAATKAAGAEVIIAKDGPTGFAMAHEIADKEDRVFVHPFDGMRVAEATAGVAAELIEDAGGLDAIVVAIGGGGLAGGLSAGAKLIDQNIKIFGVEPEGAAAMALSFKNGEASTLEQIETIADSLAPPMTTETTFGLCSKNIDKLGAISDDEMAAAAYLLFRDHKLAVEPGGAASTAAALTRFNDEIAGKRVGVILCGSNIDPLTFCELLKRGEDAFAAGKLN